MARLRGRSGEGQLERSLLLMPGIGGAAENQAATRCLRDIAEQDHRPACSNAASLAVTGRGGTDRDLVVARYWTDRARSLGFDADILLDGHDLDRP